MSAYDDEYEDDTDGDSEDYRNTARNMNELTAWLNDMPPDLQDFMMSGTLAAAHARICADEVMREREEEENDEDDEDAEDDDTVFPQEERELFGAWLARLHDGLNRLRCIMNQTAIPKFKLGAYQPALRKPTPAEREKIAETMDEEDEEDEDI
jgi:hypothetical protein